MNEEMKTMLEEYLESKGLSPEDIKEDTTGLRRIAKNIIVDAFNHFYPIIVDSVTLDSTKTKSKKPKTVKVRGSNGEEILMDVWD